MTYKEFTNVRVSEKENTYFDRQGFLVTDPDDPDEDLPKDMVEVSLGSPGEENMMFRVDYLEYYNVDEKEWEELEKLF